MKILYVKINDFGVHIDSQIDFTKFSSALIVGMNNNNPDSSNGSGKTTLVRAIGWCWFEKVRETTKKIRQAEADKIYN